MTDTEGIMQTDTTQINKIFKDYYAKLYSKQDIDMEGSKKFLFELTLPQLTEKQVTILNNPMTEQEVTGIVKQLSNNKTPGSDGFPVEFYKMLRETIKTDITELWA